MGFALCAVPILIHLLFRRRYRSEPWAAMRFLRVAVQKQSRQIRLESLLMMILRTLVIGLVVLAVAQPVFRSSVSLSGRNSVRWILVLDCSLSMGVRTDGLTAFERGRDELLKVVDTSAPGDTFNLIRISTLPPTTVVRRPTNDLEDFRAELNRLKPTDEYGDVLRSLEQVVTLLEEPTTAEATRVIIATDLQASNWDSSDPAQQHRWERTLAAITQEARLTLLDTAGDQQFNMAFADTPGL